MTPYRVVIPSKSPEALRRALGSFLGAHPGFDPHRFIVVGGFDRDVSHPSYPLPWVDQKTPFNTSQTWNDALRVVPGDADVVLLSDDVLCRTHRLFDLVAAYSREFEGRAIWMPAVSGMDFKHPLLKPGHELRREYVEVPFVCPYIPARVRKAVGDFDERYAGYGMEDFDYCLRALQKGYRIYVASMLEAHHIPGASEWRRALGGEGEEFRRQLGTNDAIFESKWGSHFRTDFAKVAREDWAQRRPAS